LSSGWPAIARNGQTDGHLSENVGAVPSKRGRSLLLCSGQTARVLRRIPLKRLLPTLTIGLVLGGLILASCAGPASTTVRVATDATWPPFESVNDQTKQIEGFDIDLLKAIADKQGLKIEFVNVAFDPLLAGMAQGTYDAAISSISITEDRKKDMVFSDPYYAAGQIVVVRKDNTTITGPDKLTGSVGAQIGTTGAMEVEKVKSATLKTYDDIGLAFQDLMNGQINAVVSDNWLALGYVAKNPNALKTAGPMFTSESYGIAVAKGKADLLAKINAGLAAVKADGLIETLSKKWIEK
jgi:ABC-type amino acid transport substrate-binding protein